MWYLSRLLPLILHDLIPEENLHLEFFNDLMKIFDLLVSPITSLGTTLYLRLLIQEYLQEFKKLYPDINLIPKQHFMVHYASQIRRQAQVIIIAMPGEAWLERVGETTGCNDTLFNSPFLLNRNGPLVRQWWFYDFVLVNVRWF